MVNARRGRWLLAAVLALSACSAPATSTPVAQWIEQWASCTQWPVYIAYLASFVYVGVSWVNHHQLSKICCDADAPLAAWATTPMISSSGPTTP